MNEKHGNGIEEAEGGKLYNRNNRKNLSFAKTSTPAFLTFHAFLIFHFLLFWFTSIVENVSSDPTAQNKSVDEKLMHRKGLSA